ncbi:MAG TPA: class I SAM-dependent methyltransferase [Rhabdochlamydiaceae bacterium]|jgi:SAM-dependent methyltransferase|nr:class I SAM-dependent methyltransferase [Rhabdochlamydiaceae bacterium]
MKITEACQLLYLHFAVKVYEWREQKRVGKLFYQDPLYKALDQALIRGPNPYRNKEAFPYGETPLCSLKKIADRCGLKSSDKVVDLGCGRGRGAFFLAQHYRCEVVGIDKVEPFIERAKRLAKECQKLKISFMCKDMREFDFRQTTFVFFYGTTFSDVFVEELKVALLRLPKGSKVVTVSYPLEGLELIDQFSVSFNWGVGDVYLHTI